MYGSLTVFDREEKEMVHKIIENPNRFNTDIKKELIKQKYIIDESIDEIQIIRNRKRVGIIDKNRLDITIMPTLECNFSCVYCYETRTKGKMQDTTIKNIKKWITNEIPKYKVVMLQWYGGEPLLDYKSIVNLTKYVNKIAKSNNVYLIKHITTNGYSLTDSKIEELFELGILNFQITIDGTKEYHNKLRPLNNGKGNFDKIINNVIAIVSKRTDAKVTVRINFNDTNLKSIPDLLDKFPKKHRNQLRVSFEPIFGDCSVSAVDNISNDEISESLAKYYEYAKTIGYDVVFGEANIHTGKLVYCYAERENQVLINFNGDIFKCSVSDFYPNERFGYISENGKLVKNDIWKDWENYPLFDDICYSCKYLPLCMGGCRKSRISNKTTGSNCALVPTNASYILKQISFQGFDNLMIDEFFNSKTS